MLLAIAFMLFALMLLAWLVAPDAERPATASVDVPAVEPIGAAAAMPH